MTNTQQMAGQELNEAIHRAVFGRSVPTQVEMRDCARRVWREQPGVQFFSDLGGFHVAPMNAEAASGPFRKDDAMFVASVPDYSRDISAAFRVMEHMRSLRFWPKLEWIQDWDRVAKWHASFHRGNGSMDHCDESAPFAICHAALKTLAIGEWPV